MNSQQDGPEARIHRAKSRSKKGKAFKLETRGGAAIDDIVCGDIGSLAYSPRRSPSPRCSKSAQSKRVNTSYQQFPPHQQHNTTQHSYHGGTTLPQGRAPISRRLHLPLRQHSRPLQSKTRPQPAPLRKQPHHTGPNARARGRISRRGKTHTSPKQQNLGSNSKCCKGLG